MSHCTTVTVDVDVNMSDFSTEDLKDELESRGELPDLEMDFFENLHTAYVTGNRVRVDEMIRELIYQEIGRII